MILTPDFRGRPDSALDALADRLPAVRFKDYEREALAMGFAQAACGPLVRSSYHADRQAHEAGVREDSP